MQPLTENVKVRLSPQEYADLRREARRDDRSVGAVIRLAVREYLAARAEPEPIASRKAS